MTSEVDFTISSLGPARCASPLQLSNVIGDYIANYVSDDTLIIYDIDVTAGAPKSYARHELLEKAGPRERIYFDPKKVHAGIVTCGGLCPGLNDVIYSLTITLVERYGAERITGIRYGYRGLLPEFGLAPVSLTPEVVAGIHHQGGTILGSSRGYGNRTTELVDSIQRLQLNILFTIGGDGTQHGALAIAEEAKRRGYELAVVGIPKTIDNDLSFVQKSFGFDTAVAEAVRAVAAAHVEAQDAINGLGIVKVMGRQSGFIAAHAALANRDVDYVLIPEVPFDLDGDNGLLRHVEECVRRRKHAVILAAEGAGQDLMPPSHERDESGNQKLVDVGLLLQTRLAQHFKSRNLLLSLKYIDPSYIIRGAPANPEDSLYSARLATNAVHAAMAGKTGMLISLVNNRFVHVPMRMAISRRNCVDPESSLWRDVIDTTGQPPLMKN